MINIEDLIGLNKKIFWVDKNQNLTYRFLKEGNGIIINSENKRVNFKFDLIFKNGNPVIKINYNGLLSYYIFNKKNSDTSYIVTYKTKFSEIKTLLFSKEVKENPKVAVKSSKKEALESSKNNDLESSKNKIEVFKLKLNEIKSLVLSKLVKNNKEDKKEVVEEISSPIIEDKDTLDENIDTSIKSTDNTDKLFISFALVLTTIFITLLIKLSDFFSQVSIFKLLLISLVISAIIIVYLREPLIYFSKKYKKEINDIIIKK